MPDVTLSGLKRDLHDRVTRGLPQTTWNGPELMADVASDVAEMFPDVHFEPDLDDARLAAAIARLGRGETLRSADLRICCLGATAPVGLAEGVHRLVDLPGLTQRLATQVEAQRGGSALRRKCVLNLAYAALAPQRRLDVAAHDNLLRLLEVVETHAERDEPSARLLERVLPLVQECATQGFHEYVLGGDAAAVVPLRRLKAPSPSWAWTAIILNALRQAAEWADRGYTTKVGDFVDVLERHEPALDLGLGLVLDRLAQVEDLKEIDRVRDLVIGRWGSPMVGSNLPAWERWTTDAGRKLVVSWVARRVIAGFFGPLAGEHADRRRTAFWSRYADVIDEFEVRLSRQSRRRGGEELRRLRSALGPVVRSVDNEDTNVFVMYLGAYAFVEFSHTNNALYVYHRDGMPASFTTSAPTVGALKDRDLVIHRPSHVHSWEPRFRELINELTAHWVKL